MGVNLDSTKSFGLIVDSVPARRDTIIIGGVGDLMLGTNYPANHYLPPKDSNMLSLAIPFLQFPDITFGNLEGTILDSGGQAKTCNDPSKCYVFRMPERYGRYFSEAGIDMLSLANNHSGDFAETGRKKTQQVLDSLGIAYAGHLDCPYTIVEKNGVTYGLCAFSPNNGTVRINDYVYAKSIVNHLDTLCDVVIASFHGGAEGPDHLHVTRKTEHYYGENRGNVYEFAHMLVDEGADVIFGHGPHIVRAVDVYKDRLICYSLGNFCTYARFNLGGKRGYAPLVLVYTDPNGRFLKGQVISFLQGGEGGPVPDLGEKAFLEIQRLTELDFPEARIVFEADGSFHLGQN